MQQISFINKNDSSAASVSYVYPVSGNTANLTMEIRQHLSCCLCSFSCFNSLARATSAMLSFNSEEQAFLDSPYLLSYITFSVSFLLY